MTDGMVSVRYILPEYPSGSPVEPVRPAGA